MEYIFNRENILEFIKQFQHDSTCLETLSNLKGQKASNVENVDTQNIAQKENSF